MSSKFSPKPNDKITLFGQVYTFQEHPNAPGMLHSMVGGRAYVYPVRNARGERFGLKVFKEKFRDDERIAESESHLRKLEKLRGLSAARRQIIAKTEPAARKYPALVSAVLMPWIEGPLWTEILIHAADHGAPYGKPGAIQLCTDFLETISNLERQRVAHTDISAGNVIFRAASRPTELLDLEDVYMPGAKQPSQTTPGTPNYQHAAKKPTWCPEGDRYATAVLASEILLLSDATSARKATDSGFFGGHREAADACERYEEAQRWFQTQAPTFGELFHVTWFATSLDRCPPISALLDAASKLSTGSRVQVFTPPSKPEDGQTDATPPVQVRAGDPVQVSWEPIRQKHEPNVIWVKQGDMKGSGAPVPAPVILPPPRPKRRWMICAIVIAIVLLIIMGSIASYMSHH
jgi:hypothetical protein